MTSLWNRFNSSLISKWLGYTLVPVFVFTQSLISTLVQDLVLKFRFFWKVGNYADAYWFLYSNKQVASYVRGSGYIAAIKSSYTRVRNGKVNSARFRIKYAVRNFNHQFNYRLNRWGSYKK
jgi:hypothetical protein